MSMKYCIALAVVVTVASAGNLRRMATTMKQEEAVSVVNALAIKYDCHNAEANLGDTLTTILAKNGDEVGKVNGAFTTEKQTLEQTKTGADIVATGVKDKAVAAAQEEHNKETKAATDARLMAETTQTDQVLKVDQIAAKADASHKANGGDWAAATSAWSAAQAAKPISIALAATNKKNRDTDLDSVAAGATAAATTAHAEAEAAANTAMKAAKKLCTESYTTTTAQLTSDDGTVTELSGLVDNLNLCKKSTTLPAAAGTALLEVASCAEMEAEVMRFKQVLTPSLLEVGEPVAATGTVPTGDIADMKRRLQEYAAKASADQTKCNGAANTVQQASIATSLKTKNTAINEAADTLSTEKSKAITTHSNAYAKALKVHSDAERLFNTHKEVEWTLRSALTTATATASQVRDAADKAIAELNKKFNEAIAALNVAQKDLVKKAEDALKASKESSAETLKAAITGITTTKTNALETLSKERDTISSVKSHLTGLKVVHQEIPAVPVPSSLPASWYDCNYKGFKSCVDDSVCKGDGGETVCAKSTVDNGKCSTDRATYCGSAATPPIMPTESKCTSFAKGVKCTAGGDDPGFGSYCHVAKVTEQCAKQYCYKDVHCRSQKCEGGQCEDDQGKVHVLPVQTPQAKCTKECNDMATATTKAFYGNKKAGSFMDGGAPGDGSLYDKYVTSYKALKEWKGLTSVVTTGYEVWRGEEIRKGDIITPQKYGFGPGYGFVADFDPFPETPNQGYGTVQPMLTGSTQDGGRTYFNKAAHPTVWTNMEECANHNNVCRSHHNQACQDNQACKAPHYHKSNTQKFCEASCPTALLLSK